MPPLPQEAARYDFHDNIITHHNESFANNNANDINRMTSLIENVRIERTEALQTKALQLPQLK